MHLHFHGHGDPRDIRDRPEKTSVGEVYARLLQYVKPYWHVAATVLALTLVTSFMSVLPVQAYGLVIQELAPATAVDRVTGQLKAGRSRIPIERPIRAAAEFLRGRWFTGTDARCVMLVTISVAFLLLHAVAHGVEVTHGFIMARLGQRVIYDMRSEVYRHVQALSLRFFEDKRTGDIMSRIVNDVNSLQQVIVQPVITFLTDMLRLGWLLYFMLRWDWPLTLLTLLVVPLLLTVTAIFGTFIRREFKALRRKVGDLNALTQDNISGIRVIKAFCREEHEAGRFDEKNEDNFRQNVKLARMFSVFRPVITMLNEIGTVTVLCFGGYRVLTGAMEVKEFVTFIAYVGMLYGPVTGLTRFYNHIQRAVASTERVFELLDTEPGITSRPDARTIPRLAGRVELRDVSFSYANEIEVLSEIGLAAEPGQMIALVGPSGAGKTTLTNLIPRFYDPTRGTILVDGHDLRELEVASVRGQMAMVLQEPFLFNDTVGNNIAYGKLGATEDEIVASAKSANAHQFVMELPEQYDTQIGERGIKLSGGQKQRVSIARAILADPRILILDEATSSVDSETELLIQNAIMHLVEDRTTFVIAHRLSTVLHADLIVVLDRGRVVEAGRHQELLAGGRLYAKLYEMQFRGGEDGRSSLEVPCMRT